MIVNAVVGTIVVVVALVFIAGLVLWCRRSIDRIETRDLHSARDIVRDRNHV